MGELLLPIHIPEPDMIADSAGTRGLPSHPIDPSSGHILQANGIDASGFRSKRITPQLVQSSDLILCFEQPQRTEIATIAPTASRRTFLLADFANMCAYCANNGLMQGSTRQERLESVIFQASMIRPMLPDPLNIADPYRRSMEYFEQAYRHINQALSLIAQTTQPQ